MKRLILSTLILPILFLTSCSSDDDDNVFMGETKIYTLNSVTNPSISGTAKFIENENGSTTVEISLSGTPSGGTHPAHIHYNTAAEGGDIAVSLTSVNGDTGKSVTTFSKLATGASITYDQLMEFDGYINVHLSGNELTTLVAQGDIGQNELTGTSKVYALNSVGSYTVNGTAKFFERVNGEALAILDLTNTVPNSQHPAHIHANDIATTGNVIFTFSPVNGDTGLSATNVSQLNSGTAFGYDDVLAVDGYINVHLSAAQLTEVVAQGNIGIN